MPEPGDLIDKAKEVFDSVSEKEDFADAPQGKKYVSRMMWWNYMLLFAFLGMLIWTFFYTVPKSSVKDYKDDAREAKIGEDKAIAQKDSIQRELNAFLRQWVPQARENNVEVDNLKRKTDSLMGVINAQNQIVAEYNRSFKKIKP